MRRRIFPRLAKPLLLLLALAACSSPEPPEQRAPDRPIPVTKAPAETPPTPWDEPAQQADPDPFSSPNLKAHAALTRLERQVLGYEPPDPLPPVDTAAQNRQAREAADQANASAARAPAEAQLRADIDQAMLLGQTRGLSEAERASREQALNPAVRHLARASLNAEEQARQAEEESRRANERQKDRYRQYQQQQYQASRRAQARADRASRPTYPAARASSAPASRLARYRAVRRR